jgi:hypothetical protein
MVFNLTLFPYFCGYFFLKFTRYYSSVECICMKIYGNVLKCIFPAKTILRTIFIISYTPQSIVDTLLLGILYHQKKHKQKRLHLCQFLIQQLKVLNQSNLLYKVKSSKFASEK